MIQKEERNENIKMKKSCQPGVKIKAAITVEDIVQLPCMDILAKQSGMT